MASTNAARYDAIVLGVGTMGAAACLALARRGQRILGLEQFDIPHTLGSHHGHSRMFRLAYYEHPDYVPLLRRSLAMWHALNSESRSEVFITTGGLYIGRPDRPALAGALSSAGRHGIAHELLDRAELAHRFPQFRVGEWALGLYEPDAGFIRPELAVETMTRLAISKGAEVRTRTPVLHWAAGPRGVEVRTASERFEAERLVVTAGAWSREMGGLAGARLSVARQIVGWVRPLRPECFGPDRFPCWAVEADDGVLHYGFPLDGGRGLKVARHGGGSITDPESINRTPVPADEQTFRPALETYLPDAAGPTMSMSVCMYTNSPDSHFIIDLHPASDRVSIACGFSGHGFKFAPVVGEALADLVMLGRSTLPIGFLGLHRLTLPAAPP